MRHITPEHRKEAARLKKEWSSRKRTLGLTQCDVAKQLGWTQGAVSQYLNAHVALNTDTILTFARLLQISPNKIRPGILNNLKNKETSIMLYTTSGKEPSKDVWSRIPDVSENALVVYIDNAIDKKFRAQEGEYIVFEKGLNPRKGDEVVHIDKTQTATLKKWSSRVNYTGIITSIHRAPE